MLLLAGIPTLDFLWLMLMIESNSHSSLPQGPTPSSFCLANTFITFEFVKLGINNEAKKEGREFRALYTWLRFDFAISLLYLGVQLFIAWPINQ